VNRAVAERRRERGVDTAMLVEEGEGVELGAHDGDLEVVAGARSVLDSELGGVWERLLEKCANRWGVHPRPC